MHGTLTPSALAAYTARQLNHFFPDPHPVAVAAVKKLLPETLARLEKCLAATKIKYFVKDGRPWFDHLHSDQYAMFLYLLSRVASGKNTQLATKIYLLNKALHSLDIYFEVQLPEIFLLAHPVGTVLGRAQYNDYLVVTQNCTVGNIGGKYPKLGKRIVLYSGSSVLGESVLGDECCVGAGSLLLNARVPAKATAVGRGSDLRILKSAAKWRDYFS